MAEPDTVSSLRSVNGSGKVPELGNSLYAQRSQQGQWLFAPAED
jgi:hypothetical protein